MTGETDPLELLRDWQADALDRGQIGVSDAVLATATPQGEPSARVISIKRIGEDALVFTSRLGTRKTDDLATNPRCAITLWWPAVRRQVRLACKVEPLAQAQTAELFAGRPLAHQVATVASEQGQPIESLDQLREEVAALAAGNAGEQVAMPEAFASYRAVPFVMEFWEEADNRLHTRLEFSRSGAAWQRQLLAP